MLTAQPKIPFDNALLYSYFLFPGDEPGVTQHEKLGGTYFIHRDNPGISVPIETAGHGENPEVIPYQKESAPWTRDLILA